MANIMRRKESWDPFRMMRELMQWDPFRSDQPVPYGGYEGEATFSPTFDVKETKDAYVFKADLPGIKEEDLDIQLHSNRLTISGRREAEAKNEGETWYTYECQYGSFHRAFTLPEGVDADNVRAQLKDGILTLHVPKKPEVQPKRIALGAGGGHEAKKAKA